MIQLTLLHRSETWAVSQKVTDKINKFERKIVKEDV